VHGVHLIESPFSEKDLVPLQPDHPRLLVGRRPGQGSRRTRRWSRQRIAQIRFEARGHTIGVDAVRVGVYRGEGYLDRSI
jgi:hypothetical protein